MRRTLFSLLLVFTTTVSVVAQTPAGDPGGYFTDGGSCAQACEECCSPKLLGFISPTNMCASDYISPMTNPVFFEDPRTLSEVRVIFAHHGLPGNLGGGNIQLLAAQIRAAVTDRLSIIATKDGYFWMDNVPFNANDGWADIGAGLKYNFYVDDCYNMILSGGLTYELPTGSTRTLQGNGDGEFNIFATGGARIGQSGHVLSAAGIRLPADTAAESQMFYWSNHIDKQINGTNFYIFGEANWYHYMSSGRAIPGLNVGGLDLFNFGAGNVAGNDIVTVALGGKFKPTQWQEIGIAAEVPVTAREDVLDYRLTADWIFRY